MESGRHRTMTIAIDEGLEAKLVRGAALRSQTLPEFVHDILSSATSDDVAPSPALLGDRAGTDLMED